MRRVPLRDLVVLILSLSALAAAGTVLRLLPDVSTTTVSLAFLLVVLATATVGHLWAAIVVSIAAMLTLNFFFLPPLGTFTIADPQNWIALFAFLVVAVIASNLSAAAQARTSEAIASRKTACQHIVLEHIVEADAQSTRQKDREQPQDQGSDVYSKGKRFIKHKHGMR